jgi:hypothetical protein
MRRSTFQNRRLESIQSYGSQAKILEIGTNDLVSLFETLFKSVRTVFGLFSNHFSTSHCSHVPNTVLTLLSLEKIFEKTRPISSAICCSVFQHLRLESVNYRKGLTKPFDVNIVYGLKHVRRSYDFSPYLTTRESMRVLVFRRFWTVEQAVWRVFSKHF